MKVADVMSRHVDYVTEATRVEKLCILIFGHGINGVPVLRNRKVVGFITAKDILAKFFPSIQEYVEDPFSSSDFEGMEDKVKNIFELRADEIMSKNLFTVTADTPLLKAQSMMFVEHVGRLPVIDEKGNLIGIISKGDVFRALVGDKIIFSEEEDYTDWLSRTYYASVDTEDRLKHEIPDLLKVFEERGVKRVLDVGCGTGDHIIDLAKKGFECVGVDRSKAMINEANRRKKGMSESAQARAKFMEGDMEKVLETYKNSPFDAILFMGNAISHNPNIYKDIIKNSASILTDKGVMIFQITNFTKVLETNKRFSRFNIAKIDEEPGKEFAFLQFYDEPDIKKETILKTFSVLISSGGRWRSSGVRNSLLAYVTKENLEKALHKIGFKSIEFYGSNFDGKRWDYLFRKPFDKLQSDWLTAIVRK